jgi:peroxiredoxin
MEKVFLLPLITALGLAGAPDRLEPPAPGAKVADCSAKDVTGTFRSLGEYKSKKAIVVVFVGTECPISNLQVVTLVEMHQKYSPKGVQFLAVNSNDHDTYDEVVQHAKERKVPFPVLKDADQSVAEALGARRTPEAFLLDSDLVIRYHGRVDDQYGYTYRRAAPTKTELKDAIDEVLAGKPVTVPEVKKFDGCIIGRSKKATNRPTK